MRRLLLPLLAALSIAAGPAEEAQRLWEAGQEREAFELVERGAAVGDAEATDQLAWFYETGSVVEQDMARAASLYRRAAERGFAPAQWRLGVMLDQGEGVEEDPREAVTWFVRAAALGSTDALTSLAVMHATGRGVAQNYPEAMRLYREAALRGNRHGFYGVGVMFAYGQGVRADPVEAFAWLAVAASMGDEDAPPQMDRLDLDDRSLAAAVARANRIVEETGADAPTIVVGPDGDEEGREPAERRPNPIV